MSDVVTLKQVKKDPQVKAYIDRADEYLAVIGYTEHGPRHCGLVAKSAFQTLVELGVPEREAELSAIAGYLHDIGNVFNRVNHAYTGAVLAHTLLRDMGMDPTEITAIVAAIGSHDDNGYEPVSRISAGLILADKSDVHRSRVRNPDMIKFDIHDRVNYAVQKSFLQVDNEKKTITLFLKIDLEISSVMEYFEIFLNRMLYCKRAANFLGCRFSLAVNDNYLL
ncbi:HD domain-containing protein [candidate division KSB1 bacterium]|nr:HD domain-containing protein [candidate division KSB1 bacterium]NIR68812.1 HD domain-containing protein [candidate division KSB1 bacterium]NIS27175.1 HD domain-containing protein [candidate division KSB1 bacterium]NIT74060.1 HD domain-containing protein [candidate division KSB1 bacterium]NIU26925.1 HD domain-containing protein [candidate division KSB1 bacterium]